MADEDTELSPDTILSAQEIDDVVSQFRLFSRRLSPQQMHKFVSELPKMTEADLVAFGRQDDVCPICFNTFLATLAEEEVAHAMDSPAHPLDELGVTRLHNTCGHVFCRKDITRWITDGHDSCPACRRPLVADRQSLDDQPTQGWLRPWVADPVMVARETGPPAHLPTLSIDSLRAFGVQDNRHPYTGMYS